VEWASSSNNLGSPGGTTDLMATAAKECVKLGLHLGGCGARNQNAEGDRART